jgi:hypothetical protein
MRIVRMSGWRRWASLGAAGVLLQFGGCGLSDSQISSIVTSLVSTGLNTLVTQFIQTVLGGAGGAA